MSTLWGAWQPGCVWSRRCGIGAPGSVLLHDCVGFSSINWETNGSRWVLLAQEQLLSGYRVRWRG